MRRFTNISTSSVFAVLTIGLVWAISTVQLSAETQQQASQGQQNKKGQGKNQDPNRKKGEGKQKKGGENQKKGGNQAKDAGKRGPAHVFAGDAPKHDYDIILTRPTDSSVTLSLLGYKSGSAFVEYAREGQAEFQKTSVVELKPELPVEIVLDSLQADTKYKYRLSTRFAESGEFKPAPVYSFQTQRKPGSAFSFAVQADSHLDQGTRPEIYELTLANMNAYHPDLLIDLGDTFMTDKYRDFKTSQPQYMAQRYYFGLIGRATPVFLTLGNHDGERLDRYSPTGESMAVWSNQLRTKLFPNPVPNSFYSGNEKEMPPLGKIQNYFEWKWGDAQFIVLDPFWSTHQRGRGDANGNWSRTLGDEQFHWLEKVLAESKSKYKFVFIHHLVGGLDESARGGSEAAAMYEWGGLGATSMEEFRAKRPGWSMPIHQLLVKHKASVVFHGHDHFFARQDLDGVSYLLVPQPGHASSERMRSAEEYGYKKGDFLPPAGHVRVNVTPEQAVVDYVRTYLPQNETAQRKNGEISYTFKIPPAR